MGFFPWFHNLSAQLFLMSSPAPATTDTDPTVVPIVARGPKKGCLLQYGCSPSQVAALVDILPHDTEEEMFSIMTAIASWNKAPLRFEGACNHGTNDDSEECCMLCDPHRFAYTTMASSEKYYHVRAIGDRPAMNITNCFVCNDEVEAHPTEVARIVDGDGDGVFPEELLDQDLEPSKQHDDILSYCETCLYKAKKRGVCDTCFQPLDATGHCDAVNAEDLDVRDFDQLQEDVDDQFLDLVGMTPETDRGKPGKWEKVVKERTAGKDEDEDDDEEDEDESKKRTERDETGAGAGAGAEEPQPPQKKRVRTEE